MRSKPPLKLAAKIAFRTPQLMPRILSGLYHKHIRTDLDYLRGNGRASKPPIQISLRITNACNHRCAVCGQYGTTGYMKTEKGRNLLRTLPAEAYKKLIDEVAPHKPILYVTGGEAMLYPEIMEVMNYAVSKGIIATIVTNGAMLKERAEEIVKNKWAFVLVSLDGPEEVHDKCRGVKGAFKAAYEGIEALQACKKKYVSALPYVGTSTTISSANVAHLKECFELGRKLLPDEMILYLSWFTSEKIGEAQGEVLKREFGADAFTWQSYAKAFTEKEAQQFADAVVALKKEKWPFDYFIIPDVGNSNYKKYYAEPENFFGYSRCAAPFIMVDVMPNGDVVTCRDFVDIKVGNITEKPLLEIWNDAPFVKFRKALIKSGGTFPQCSRCCGLMGF